MKFSSGVYFLVLCVVSINAYNPITNCKSPIEWLRENPGGCDNNHEMWQRDWAQCFFQNRHYRCNPCYPGWYHKRYSDVPTIGYAGAYPWQLGEGGMQICLECPKWTLWKGTLIPDTEQFSTYDNNDNFRAEDACLLDCPPVNRGQCTNAVVDSEYSQGNKVCSKCPAGKTKFSADLASYNFGVFPGVSTGSRRPLQVGMKTTMPFDDNTYNDFEFMGYNLDDVKIPNILDFDYITTCKRCPSGMIQAPDWDGSLGKTDYLNQRLSDLLLDRYEDPLGWELDIAKSNRDGQRCRHMPPART